MNRSTPRLTKKLAAVGLAGLLTTVFSGPTAAFVAATDEDADPTKAGPGLAYINGRVPGRDAPLPAGTVLPDEFCIPNKVENCEDPLGLIEEPGATTFSDAEYAAWSEIQFRETEQLALSETRTSTTFAAGIDRTFGPRLVLGAMGQILNEETVQTGPTRTDRANGLMFGPYFVFKPTPTLSFDGRLLYGEANHDYIFGGAVTGSYKSTRTAASIRGAAELSTNNFTFFPSLELSYGRKDSEAYTDTLFGPVAAKTDEETFMTGGLLAYYDGLGTGNLRPYAGLQGSTDVANGGSLFGVARVGLDYELENGTRFNAEYAHGAIGLANVNDTRISFGIEIPF